MMVSKVCACCCWDVRLLPVRASMQGSGSHVLAPLKRQALVVLAWQSTLGVAFTMRSPATRRKSGHLKWRKQGGTIMTSRVSGHLCACLGSSWPSRTPEITHPVALTMWIGRIFAYQAALRGRSWTSTKWRCRAVTIRLRSKCLIVPALARLKQQYVGDVCYSTLECKIPRHRNKPDMLAPVASHAVAQYPRR